jgi:hypothetical protein
VNFDCVFLKSPRVRIPDRTRYIQCARTHGILNLSPGAAGLTDENKGFFDTFSNFAFYTRWVRNRGRNGRVSQLSPEKGSKTTSVSPSCLRNVAILYFAPILVVMQKAPAAAREQTLSPSLWETRKCRRRYICSK